MPASIKFDFSVYPYITNPFASSIELREGDCIQGNFILTVLAENLVPGNRYEIKYELLNPNTNPGNPINIFNPSTQQIYASFSSQNLATVADLQVQGEYILQATIKDITNGPTGGAQASAIVNLRCGPRPIPSPTSTPTPTVTPSRLFRQNNLNVEILDPEYGVPDGVVDISNCANDFPLIGLAKGAIIGNKYSYKFFDNPPNSIVFENKEGEFYAGSGIQNFNTKIAITGSPYVFIQASVKDIASDIEKISEPVLFKIGRAHV